MKQPATAQPGRAFTLVEILVVLGILSVLTSLLLAATVKLQQRARQVACMSNLNQIGTLAVVYAQNHNGHLWPGEPYNSLLPGFPSWTKILMERTWQQPELLCPEDPAERKITYMLSLELSYRQRLFRPTDTGIPASQIILSGENIPGEELAMSTSSGRDPDGYALTRYDQGQRHGLRHGSHRLWMDMHVSNEPVVRFGLARDSWWPGGPVFP